RRTLVSCGITCGAMPRFLPQASRQLEWAFDVRVTIESVNPSQVADPWPSLTVCDQQDARIREVRSRQPRVVLLVPTISQLASDPGGVSCGRVIRCMRSGRASGASASRLSEACAADQPPRGRTSKVLE